MADILRLGFAGLGEAATLVLPEILELPYIKVTAAADLRRDALGRFRREAGLKISLSTDAMVQYYASARLVNRFIASLLWKISQSAFESLSTVPIDTLRSLLISLLPPAEVAAGGCTDIT